MQMAHLHQRSPWTADRHKKKSKTSPPGKLPEVAEEQVDGHAGVCSSQGQHKAAVVSLQACRSRPLICGPAHLQAVAQWQSSLKGCCSACLLNLTFTCHVQPVKHSWTPGSAQMI